MTALLESSFVLAFDPITIGPKDIEFLVCRTPIPFRPDVLILQTMVPVDLHHLLIHDIYVEREPEPETEHKPGRSGRQTSYVLKASPRAVLPASLFAQGRELRLPPLMPEETLVLKVENDSYSFANLVASYLGMGAS